MENNHSEASLEVFERTVSAQEQEEVVLQLYITGLTPRSTHAIESVRLLCERHLSGCCALEVIDLYQHPELAEPAHVVAVPTLIKQRPLPLRRILGDMSDQNRILVELDLQPKA